jgi:hypothetical protein
MNQSGGACSSERNFILKRKLQQVDRKIADVDNILEMGCFRDKFTETGYLD